MKKYLGAEMNIAQIKVWLILLISTFILLIGIVFSIFMSTLYLSPLGNNYAEKELNKLDNIILNDYSVLRDIFLDFNISKEEIKIIDNLNIVKNHSGNIKFIIQERDRKVLYSKGVIDNFSNKPQNYLISVGKLSIDFVASFKKVFFHKIKNDCNNYFRNPFTIFQDKIEVYEIQCSFNLNKSMMRIYKGKKNNSSYIISKSIPLYLDNKVAAVIYLSSDARNLEEDLGVILLSILAPVIFSIFLVSFFIIYLQKYLRLKINNNWINAKNIAHNLKNKTNAIKYYNSKYFDNIEMYKNNSIKISNVISNLDNFIETTLNTAKQNHYETLNDDSNDFVDINILIDLLKTLYLSKNVSFKFNLDSTKGLIIKGNKNKLIEAISASIDNSLHWSLSSKNILINIYKNNNFIDLIVSDRGPGINDKDKKNIFFKQYSRSNGNGIGLYIAKNIVVSYGGNLYPLDRKGGGLDMVYKLKLLK
jgi:signal transduction histidine kinase